MIDPIEIKKVLYSKCVDYVEQRINNIKQAEELVSESGSDQTKSSSGDKHETGRAMMHLEQEKLAVQLAEAVALKQVLEEVQRNKGSKIVTLGSLVITDKGNFYFTISTGKITVDDQLYFVVSPKAPIAGPFMGAKEKDQVAFNSQAYLIKGVY